MHPTTKQWRALRKAIGSNIQYYRTRQKLTLKKLSKLSGVPEIIIDHYELGKNEIRFPALIKISTAMEVDLRRLLEWKD